MITYTTEPKGRLVHACCDMCHAVCDGIYQNASLSGAYVSERHMLAMQGWLEFAGHDFCGKGCRDKYRYANERLTTVVPVTTPIIRPIPSQHVPQRQGKR